jgi:hypothetical protein
MKQTTFTLYFFAIGIVFIILENFQLFLPALLFKAMIMPALMIYYHSKAKNAYTIFHRLIMVGLLFSWFGDILLHFSYEQVELYFNAEKYSLAREATPGL